MGRRMVIEARNRQTLCLCPAHSVATRGFPYFIVGSLSNRCATTLGSLLGRLQM